jgi:chemotaxis protein methyltransferase CheR
MQKVDIEISDKEFELFQKLVFNEIGISLGNTKKFLVKNRLYKQLLAFNLSSYSDYYRLVQINKLEKTNMLNIITTNETYFFREPNHFKFLEENLLEKNTSKLRVWSAACSVGSEAYSVAMILDNANIAYEIIGSDINTEVVQKATTGLYPIKWMDKISLNFKQKYCLKGKGRHEGWFLVDRILLDNMKFQTRNLILPQKDLGLFDVIFLRNVLIYFNDETKEIIIKNVLSNLKVGGYLIISLTEHIHNLEKYNIKKVDNSIFQKEKS